MGKFISRKLLIAILIPIALVINNQLSNPLDEKTVTDIIYVIVAYILGQSAVDYAVAKNGK
ncbi:MAG: hypothetical protein KKH98_05320 [Spirochaetes bacterium]|nr:hypothetical protein [Spirochaetota bacterium]